MRSDVVRVGDRVHVSVLNEGDELVVQLRLTDRQALALAGRLMHHCGVEILATHGTPAPAASSPVPQADAGAVEQPAALASRIYPHCSHCDHAKAGHDAEGCGYSGCECPGYTSMTFAGRTR